jgi:hypothetical protein
VWVLIAGGITVGALLFALAAWRGSAGEASDLVAVPPVANG